jgi:hypothetical protein
VPEVSGEFGDVCEVSLLACGLRRRNADHGGDQRFVICEELELPTLKEKPEMANGGECGQQLSVKCRVLQLWWR